MEPAPRKSPLPLPPIGIDRAQAAAYIGVDVELFDRLVAERRMPEPRTIHGRLAWDTEEVAGAFRRLPHRAPHDSVETHVTTKPDQTNSGYANAYTPETLAERWGCSAQHIRNLIGRGKLPAVRLGGQLLRIRGQDVKAFELQEEDSLDARGGRLYTPESLAEHWHCSAQLIRNMVADGSLPAFRLGGKLVRIREEDVEAFERGRLLDSRKSPAVPEIVEPEPTGPKKRRSPTYPPGLSTPQLRAAYRRHMRDLREREERQRRNSSD